MDFQLLVVRGRSATEALKLEAGVTTVGRQDDCNIRIKSSQVSRKHCELFEKKGLLLIKDLGSANGTFVNGKKVDGQRVLESGDELTIGGVKLRVAKIGQVGPVKPAVHAKSDTAELATVPAAPKSDDEFEIDFDDDVTSTGGKSAEEFEIDIDDTPQPMSPPSPAAAPASKKEPAAPAAKQQAKGAQPDMADEAIADFLLEIKIDEDE